MKVIHIDDDARYLEIVKEMLTNEGIEVIESEAGLKEAAFIIKNSDYDVALIDVDLTDGGCEGIWLCKLAKTRPGVKVIMVTAHGGDTLLMTECFKNGADYMHDKMSYIPLYKVIKDLLSGKLVSSNVMNDIRDNVVKSEIKSLLDLTDEDIKIAEFDKKGLTKEEIAKIMKISPFTVRNRLQDIKAKLGRIFKL